MIFTYKNCNKCLTAIISWQEKKKKNKKSKKKELGHAVLVQTREKEEPHFRTFRVRKRKEIHSENPAKAILKKPFLFISKALESCFTLL